MKKIRILVVDDSLLVRQILSQGLQEDPDLEVVAAVNNPYEARDAIALHKPDVLSDPAGESWGGTGATGFPRRGICRRCAVWGLRGIPHAGQVPGAGANRFP